MAPADVDQWLETVLGQQILMDVALMSVAALLARHSLGWQQLKVREVSIIRHKGTGSVTMILGACGLDAPHMWAR